MQCPKDKIPLPPGNMGCPKVKKPLPPGNMGCPIIGKTFQFFRKGASYYAEKFTKYGNVFKTKILGDSTIIITGSDNLKTLIDREPQQLVLKWPLGANDLMGPKSLLSAVGPELLPLKNNLLRAFTPFRMADYLPCVQKHIRTHLMKWMDDDKDDMLAYPSCKDLMLDILLELVIGYRTKDDTDGKLREAFWDMRDNLFSVPIRFPGFGFNKAFEARNVVSDLIESKLLDHASNKECVTMMDVFLTLHGEDGETDMEKAKDNAFGILLGGSAATASALTCLLLLLGTHPEVLEKVREELRSAGLFGKAATASALTCLLLLLGTHPEVLEKVREELRSAGLFGKDAVKELGYDQLQKLEYVQCVEKESLRCLPPVYQCFRKIENDMELNNFHIPKDWKMVYSIGHAQGLASKRIPDGNLFRPSRWLETDENSDGLSSSSFQYIPFGAGPRMCVGHQLARLILHTFIVELALTARWEVINPECPLTHLPFTRPKDDMPVKFHQLSYDHKLEMS